MSFLRTTLDRLAGQQHLSHQEMLLSSLIALLVMAMVTWISYHFLPHSAALYIVASMGASTVLLMAVPSSPMSRAWPLLASHFSCAVVGVTCLLYVPNQLLAIPLAVAGAILAMYYLRCLHPPGGATAMLTVLAGAPVAQLGYQFVIMPVFLNALVLWAAAKAGVLLLERHHHKHLDQPAPSPGVEQIPDQTLEPPFESEDLQSALDEMETFIDVNEDELMRLYQKASHHYHTRSLDDQR
jgi:CBS domain-containing membrane protein